MLLALLVATQLVVLFLALKVVQLSRRLNLLKDVVKVLAKDNVEEMFDCVLEEIKEIINEKINTNGADKHQNKSRAK